ncbi:hypothetical protein [Paenibacillus marinisediminis]
MGPHRDHQGRLHRDKGGSDGKAHKNSNQPPCPPKHPLTVQKVVVIAALLCEWLRIESVIVNRSKSVQVILSGDFSRFKFGQDLFNEDLLAEDIGLFEALEESGVLPPTEAGAELAAEEAATIGPHTEAEEEGLRNRESKRKRGKRGHRKLRRNFSKPRQSKKR